MLALLAWAGRTFARMSPVAKVVTIITSALLAFAMSQFDVPILEPESATSVADSYIRPEFDPAAHATKQAAQEERERTRDFPVHAVHACETLETIPGRKGLYTALDDLAGTVTYNEALEVLDMMRDPQHWASCPNLNRDDTLTRFRKVMDRSRILFQGSPDE